MTHYRHIFFDLDHTLWDFDTNSRAVLIELHAETGLQERGIAVEEMIATYRSVNAALWAKLDAGHIPKEVMRAMRFRHVLRHFGIRDEALARTLSASYLDRCPRRSALNLGVIDLLNDLRPRYGLHIITNGFREVQDMKLRASGIRGLFDVVLTSEQAQASKPSRKIFRHALRSAGAQASSSLMVGDNAKADIAGARGAGMDQVHYAPLGDGDPLATYRIAHFNALRDILL